MSKENKITLSLFTFLFRLKRYNTIRVDSSMDAVISFLKHLIDNDCNSEEESLFIGWVKANKFKLNHKSFISDLKKGTNYYSVKGYVKNINDSKIEFRLNYDFAYIKLVFFFFYGFPFISLIQTIQHFSLNGLYRTVIMYLVLDFIMSLIRYDKAKTGKNDFERILINRFENYKK
jgi:hypothetical protein